MNIFKTGLRFLLLLGGALLALWSISVIGQWIVGLDPKFAGPALTAVAGIIGLLISNWHTKTREIEQSHRPQKIEVYEEFFKILEKFLNTQGANAVTHGKIPSSLKNQFWQLNKGLLVWGSPSVIRSWLRFRQVSSEGGDSLAAMDDLLKNIRKDLGNSNFGLEKGDALRIFLSDPSELDID